MHPHLTRAGAAALLLATIVLHICRWALSVPLPPHQQPAAATACTTCTSSCTTVMPGVRFGDTVVMDDVLTEGMSRASRTVGRAQGTYVTASWEEGHPAMLLSMNVVLTDYDGYTGSTVVVMGRNDITEHVRELSVVGSTGRFRMATGYVLWKTASWRGQNAVLELDVFLRA